MSSETLDTRRRKRIVEFIVSGFKNAEDAIKFSSTADHVISVLEGKHGQHVKAHIAAPGTSIAVTKYWKGPAVLKLTFLDVPCQTDAWFIVESIRKLKDAKNKTGASIAIEQELVREKPQPQFIAIEFIPKTTKLSQL